LWRLTGKSVIKEGLIAIKNKKGQQFAAANTISSGRESGTEYDFLIQRQTTKCAAGNCMTEEKGEETALDSSTGEASLLFEADTITQGLRRGKRSQRFEKLR